MQCCTRHGWSPLVYSNPHTSSVFSHSSHRMAIPEQQQGIAVLSTLNDSEILSTVASLRVITAHLTDQYLGALVCLRSAPDDHIKAWLDCSRRFSGGAEWYLVERRRLTHLCRQHPERALLARERL